MGIQDRPVDPTDIGSFGNGCRSLGPLKKGNGKTIKKDNGRTSKMKMLKRMLSLMMAEPDAFPSAGRSNRPSM
jgi:hypothetical protein